MNNQQILDSWNKNTISYPQDLDFSNIYSSMFIDSDGVHGFLSIAELNYKDLCETSNTNIHESLKNIDYWFHESSYLIKDFILDFILEERDEDVVIEEFRTATQNLKGIYEEVLCELKNIRKELKMSSKFDSL